MPKTYCDELWQYIDSLAQEGLGPSAVKQKLSEHPKWKDQVPHYDHIRKYLRKHHGGKAAPKADEIRAEYKLKEERTSSKQREQELVKELEVVEKELEAFRALSTPQTLTINGKGNGRLEAVAVVCASDWHVEELVHPKTVSQLNEFNLEIADKRIQNFFRNTARLLEITDASTDITETILWLGGDFISGNIHEELLENTALRPIEAICWVQDRLIAGIKYLLEHTKHPIKVVCNSGNHSRITKRTHYSTEEGNSLERFMYHTMNILFKEEKRVEFLISDSYHAYVNVFGHSLRFHHGHAIRYGGGVGGIFIPTYKAIAQWNKGRSVALDVFGHFHQLKNGGNFICNGSLIGYNPFAVRIKADFERPAQKFFLFTSNGFVTAEYPVFL